MFRPQLDDVIHASNGAGLVLDEAGIIVGILTPSWDIVYTLEDEADLGDLLYKFLYTGKTYSMAMYQIAALQYRGLLHIQYRPNRT